MYGRYHLLQQDEPRAAVNSDSPISSHTVEEKMYFGGKIDNSSATGTLTWSSLSKSKEGPGTEQTLRRQDTFR